jgi:hypothetical protein
VAVWPYGRDQCVRSKGAPPADGHHGQVAPNAKRTTQSARWPRSRRGATAFCAVATAAALLVALVLAQQAAALRDHGRVGTAVITDYNSRWFDADLQLPDGRTVHATDLELANLNVAPTVGEQFTALYDPDDPSNLVDADSGPDWIAPLLCALLTVVFAGMTLAAACGAFNRKA